MTSSQQLPQAIRAWISAQLPHVQCPPDQLLYELCQAPAAARLWTYLTQRVRSQTNARTIRLSLSLHPTQTNQLMISGPQLGSEENIDDADEQLDSVQKEIAQVEQQLRDLRNQLVRADDNIDVDGPSMPEMKSALQKKLQSQVEHQDASVSELFSVLQSQMWPISTEESDIISDAPVHDAFLDVAHLLSNLALEDNPCEQADFEQVETHLDEAVRQSSMLEVLKTLQQVQQESVEQLQQNLDEEHENDMIDIIDVQLQMARVTQLRTFAEYEALVKQCVSAERALADMITQLKNTAVADELSTRLLCAQLEGERAFVAFARRRPEARTDAADVRVTKQELRRGNEVLQELYEATGNLWIGNRKLLGQGVAAWNESMVIARERLAESRDGAFRRLRQFVRDVEKRSAEVDGLTGDVAQLGIAGVRRCDDAVWECGVGTGRLAREEERLREVERVGLRDEQVIQGLDGKSGLVSEVRERMMEDVERRVFPRIQRGVVEAKNCAERDVAIVKEEMRNWVEEPAKEGMRWVDGGRWKEYEEWGRA